MKLQSRRKIGHDRCVNPAETIARLHALMSARYEYSILEETVAEHLYWTALFIEGSDFSSMGKGIHPSLSYAGALAEGAEWLFARPVGELPGYVGAREAEVENPVSIASLLAHVANATPSVLERIRSLDEAFHWVDGYSLVEQKTRKVPLEYVRLISGPNGRASGNTLEEAILHAILEVFERRAHITVLRNRMVMPTIEPSTIQDPMVHAAIAFLERHGIEVILKDLSFEGVLPCLGAYFVDHNIPADFQFRHFFKVGSSFDTREALMRLFTEYVQGRRKDEFLTPHAADFESRLQKITASEFRRIPTQPPDCDNFLSAFMFGMVPYRDANFLREGARIPFTSQELHVDCLEDIAQAQSICQLLGKDLIVVDMTDPEWDFPVVQVIVPGYSDVLPFHPACSDGLYRIWDRTDILRSYQVDRPF